MNSPGGQFVQCEHNCPVLKLANHHNSSRLRWRNLLASGNNIRCRAARRPGDVWRGPKFFANSPRLNFAVKSPSCDESMPTRTKGDSCIFVAPRRYFLKIRGSWSGRPARCTQGHYPYEWRKPQLRRPLFEERKTNAGHTMRPENAIALSQ